MVIFGAGASHDSDSDRPPATHATYAHRPPLASTLFAPTFGEWAHRYPQSQGLMPRLRTASPRIEEELEKIREEAKTQPPMRRQLAAIRYYLQGVIQSTSTGWYKDTNGGVTNYVRLLQRVEAWRSAHNERVCLVTFNYDTLLERACTGAGLGLRLANINEYVENEGYWVIRLHGSVDWFYYQSGQSTPSDQELIEKSGIGLTLGNLVRIPGWDGPTPTGHFPAVAIPTQSKAGSDFICPVDHIEVLESALRSMTKLLVVGWRGQEQHFYELWHILPGFGHFARFPQQLEQLLVVDATHDDVVAVLGNMAAGAGLSNVLASEITGGFSAAMSSREIEEFLPLR